MTCKNCGGDMGGDGYTEVRHCENVDVIGEGHEPDANLVYCAAVPSAQTEQQTETAPAQDEKAAFEAAYGTVVDNGWTNIKHMARQVRDQVRATRPAQTEQQPVAWVEVKDRHEGPYEFHGIELLDSGKHNLYAAPIAQTAPRCQCCGYLVTQSEHRGCLRAAAPQPEIEALRALLTEQRALIERQAEMVGAILSPQPEQSGLVEAAQGALGAIHDALEEAYYNAYPECCGQAHLECCGSPVQAWSEADQKIMDRFAPHERSLRAALSTQGPKP